MNKVTNFIPKSLDKKTKPPASVLLSFGEKLYGKKLLPKMTNKKQSKIYIKNFIPKSLDKKTN